MALRLQRWRHVAGDPDRLAAQGRDPVGKLEAKHAEGLVKPIEGDRCGIGGCDVPPEEMLHDEQAGCVATDGGLVCPDAGSGSVAEGVDAGTSSTVVQ